MTLKMHWLDGSSLRVEILVRDSELMLNYRYYSDAVLGFLHRKMAIQEWAKLKDGVSVSLERALTAYNLLVLHDREEDFDDVGGHSP